MAKKRGKASPKATKTAKRKMSRKSPARARQAMAPKQTSGAEHAISGAMETGAMPQMHMHAAPTAAMDMQQPSTFVPPKMEFDVGPNMTHHVLPKVIGAWQTIAIIIVAVAILGMLLSLFVFGKFFELFLRAFGG